MTKKKVPEILSESYQGEPEYRLVDWNITQSPSVSGGVWYTDTTEEVNHNMASTPSLSISKLANVAAVLALAAAAFGNTVFGISGLELVSAGLALHVGGDVLENVLS